MRLEKIKLAGFKSFVDPTTVLFPSNLVGIIGPNGCGKSNVIDAVRWVMGESSAKMLRGESMSDVIFNGSTSRKPVGTAGIELIFDNADGKAGGQYAQYNQISVKRQVSRDGQSNYYLNNVRCRRKDIADLFLGTGLGPRSYSIIEQGMISRLIEAKPEELRGYLEEAAGISKYKERRRETERRIEHTRENLDRLNDLREEVQKQLRHLERQAATAEKYKVLKQEERQAKAELLVLRLQELEKEIDESDRKIAAQENRFQSAVADQRHIETTIEQQREAHTQSNDEFNKIQGNFYAIGADIARLEEAIQYARETRQQQQEDLSQAEQTLRNATSHREHDQERLTELNEALQQDQPQLESAQAEVKVAAERLQAAEAAMQQWQEDWDSFNQRAAEPAQTAQVERTRINHLEQQEEQFKRRLARLEEEKERLSDNQLQAEINEFERQEVEHQSEVEKLETAAAGVAQKIEAARAETNRCQHALAESRSELETGKGRLASLQALQQAALGDDDKGLKNWLNEQEMSDAARLLEQLEVDPEWQSATEVVLGYLLQSVTLEDLAAVSAQVPELSSGRLTLVETKGQVPDARPGTLATKVKGPAAVIEYLNSIQMAADFAEALSRRDALDTGESFITPDGIHVGKGWMTLQRGEDANAGMLAREEEIRTLGERLKVLDEQVVQLKEDQEAAQASLKEAEQTREESQRALHQANRKLADLRAQLSGKRARAEQIRHRIEGVEKDAEELRAQINKSTDEMAAARHTLHQALSDMETLAEQREKFVAERERYSSNLEQARSADSQARNKAHEIALRVESMRTSEQSLKSGIDRIHEQLQQLDKRCQDLRESLKVSEGPLQQQQAELEMKLKDRVEVEGKLTAARQTLADIDHQLRELESQRQISEQKVQSEREKLDDARMARQEILVRSKTLEEQLAESGFTRDQVTENLTDEASVREWQTKTENLAVRIQRLGPINLAAIDEFKEQSERMEYLDRQHADVTESLETLEEAIRKIDRETRTRFKETFDRVNSGLKELFPRLFGGGHAYLELTGEDLLDTGVTVMARPPGKRNSSIHLLSGGEKALSAVALVFSIFQLNPAPFCMLDEVDAPLDDANVGRFCKMVAEMSEAVQFIFITHNKVTMEIAHQLSGVTMHEPGVSRLVSVDVDEAAALAAV